MCHSARFALPIETFSKSPVAYSPWVSIAVRRCPALGTRTATRPLGARRPRCVDGFRRFLAQLPPIGFQHVVHGANPVQGMTELS
jgi:hypothetical protein